MNILLCLVVALTPLLAPVDGELTLHEPASGATLVLPEDWSFAKAEGALMAVSENKRGFVLIAAVEDDFEQVRQDVRALILTRLDDVEVAGVQAEGVDTRGSIEEIVAAEGRGISKMDGEEVEFASMLVRSGEKGALVLGAWKDRDHAELVGKILGGLEVKQSAGDAGLELSNSRTGASVKIPDGWEVARSRKGVVARSPDGGAMAILMPWQGDFEASLEKTRGELLTWVFKDVTIGEFAAVETRYDESVGRVLAASGKAVDRADLKPVEFQALRLQSVDRNEGAVLFGAWKDDEHAKQVDKLMASIRVKETAETPEG